MHTTIGKFGGTVFLHNADLSGSVIIKRSEGELTVPVCDLIQLIGDYVRRQKIEALEKLSPFEVLECRTAHRDRAGDGY